MFQTGEVAQILTHWMLMNWAHSVRLELDWELDLRLVLREHWVIFSVFMWRHGGHVGVKNKSVKFFWDFYSITMQNLSDILPLLCTPIWPLITWVKTKNRIKPGFWARALKNHRKPVCSLEQLVTAICWLWLMWYSTFLKDRVILPTTLILEWLSSPLLSPRNIWSSHNLTGARPPDRYSFTVCQLNLPLSANLRAFILLDTIAAPSSKAVATLSKALF